jgi:hypothetical protein
MAGIVKKIEPALERMVSRVVSEVNPISRRLSNLVRVLVVP